MSAEIIDTYFREKDYYPHIPYVGVGKIIVEEAELSELSLAMAGALVEEESGGKNLFGCDWGSKWTWSPPFCQVPVTEGRVGRLLGNIEIGGGSNGVGLTQLTYPPLIREAEAMGGAHLPRYQCRVGFGVLKQYLGTYPPRYAIGAYNGGTSNPQYDYADSVIGKRNEWRKRFLT